MPKAYVNLAAGQARRFAGLVLALALLTLSGCISPPADHPRLAPAPYRQDPWDPQYPQSTCITTPHYHIFTDLQDRQTLAQLAQLMEAAHQQYGRILNVTHAAPPAPAAPMRCYVFARRDEWAAFTAHHTGDDAAIYLQIHRGAYAVDDWFVAFWLGDRGTFATMAHEGFHQYLARHFAGKMPPALEEGIACMFENIDWTGDLPRWNLTDSPARSAALADALRDNRLWSLPELLRLHAGDVIKMPRERIDTFYAQSWALATFLLIDSPRHRTAMHRYFADLAAGKAFRPERFAHLAPSEWNPNLSAPQLEHYLNTRLIDLEPAYRAYCRDLARRVPAASR